MNDRFTTHAGGLTAPASHAFVASPHDSTELSEVTRALYVGGAAICRWSCNRARP